MKGKINLEEAILRRRSVRSFTDKELSLGQIGQLLWAAQGITEKSMGFRTVPSAGALYPLEIFIVFSQGCWRYHPKEHLLEPVNPADLRAPLRAAALNQPWVEEAAASIIITAVFSRVTGRYGPRGVRYCCLEAGHCAQNILLQAVALGLDTVVIGAYDDRAVKNLLELDDSTEPLYIICVGQSRN